MKSWPWMWSINWYRRKKDEIVFNILIKHGQLWEKDEENNNNWEEKKKSLLACQIFFMHMQRPANFSQI